jgi:nucleotide-binding universal stress UspA family protein
MAGIVIAIALGWAAIGLLLSIAMGRRGHDSFGWLVTGTLLGPLAIVLAIDARRRAEVLQPASLRQGPPAIPSSGPVDVLVGFDGSPESRAAIEAVPVLLGDRLGRLTVATVVPYGEIRKQEQLATKALRTLEGRAAGIECDLELLHGQPASALSQYAAEGGYKLIAVGTRGSGITKAILGSAATQLAESSTVPVLLVTAGRGPVGSDRPPDLGLRSHPIL